MKRVLAAFLVLLLAACSRDGRVTPGSIVALDYELSVAGAVIESSSGREPLEVTQGAGNLPALVDESLLGLGIGEEKTIELTPTQGFGLVNPALRQEFSLEKFGALAKDLIPGSVVAGARDGKSAKGRVLKIADGVVTLDFNHPLAGKALRYKFKVVSIHAP